MSPNPNTIDDARNAQIGDLWIPINQARRKRNASVIVVGQQGDNHVLIVRRGMHVEEKYRHDIFVRHYMKKP